jgi:hypothetical protein
VAWWIGVGGVVLVASETALNKADQSVPQVTDTALGYASWCSQIRWRVFLSWYDKGWSVEKVVGCAKPKLNGFVSVGFNPSVAPDAEHYKPRRPTKQRFGSPVSMMDGTITWLYCVIAFSAIRVFIKKLWANNFTIYPRLLCPFRCAMAKPGFIASFPWVPISAVP